MAFNKTGDLAFVTMEPYGGGEIYSAGPQCYRLMILPNGEKEVKLLEQTVDHMLAGPAFSPDGKSICYLRINLLSGEDLARLREMMEKRQQLDAEKSKLAEAFKWSGMPMPGATQPASAPSDSGTTATAKLLAASSKLWENIVGGPALGAEVVERDATSGEVKRTVKVELPLIPYGGSDHDTLDPFVRCYLLTRLQYAPDGNEITFSAGSIVARVDLAKGTASFLDAPASICAMSPDGKTVATLNDARLGFIRADGVSTYRPLDSKVSLSGMAWADNATLGLLLRASRPNDDTRMLQLVKADGGMGKAIEIKLPKEPASSEGNEGQLAVAPDGKHICVSYGLSVYFLTADGKIVSQWNSPEDSGVILVQPVFSHDSKRIAMKKMTERKIVEQKENSTEHRTESAPVNAIVFFSPEGMELSKVDVPRIKPGTTYPATMPATAPTTGPAGATAP
jgi:hypothetical protein